MNLNEKLKNVMRNPQSCEPNETAITEEEDTLSADEMKEVEAGAKEIAQGNWVKWEYVRRSDVLRT